MIDGTMKNMKVALVHDDLVQWGGAERVLFAISEIYPEASIYTSVLDDKNSNLKKYFGDKKIITSFMQKIPGWRSLYKGLLPLYPIAFEQFDFSDFDLVISSTTRFAKSIITKPGTKHICYCHTPPRFLWNFSRVTTPKIFNSYLSFLRNYDLVSAKRVDNFIAGSKNAAERIENVYQTKALICLPFVDNKFFTDDKAFDGDYFLIISRLNKYKDTEIAIRAFNKNKKSLKIVGVGPEFNNLRKMAGDNIEFLGDVSEDILLLLIQGCKALIITGEEDFGLTSLEAQACGKPVIAYGEGGSKETVKDKITGILFKDQTEESLSYAIDKFSGIKLAKSESVNNAKRFTKDLFKENFKKHIRMILEARASQNDIGGG